MTTARREGASFRRLAQAGVQYSAIFHHLSGEEGWRHGLQVLLDGVHFSAPSAGVHQSRLSSSPAKEGGRAGYPTGASGRGTPLRLLDRCAPIPRFIVTCERGKTGRMAYRCFWQGYSFLSPRQVCTFWRFIVTCREGWGGRAGEEHDGVLRKNSECNNDQDNSERGGKDIKEIIGSPDGPVRIQLIPHLRHRLVPAKIPMAGYTRKAWRPVH